MTPRTPAASIAYALWLRARLGLAASVTATLVLVAVASAAAAPIPRMLIGCMAAIAFGSGLAHLVGVVTYGGADLSTPESGYPRHAFVFPVRTQSLVGIPMLCGCLAVALFWAALAPLAFPGIGHDVPRWWPAVTLAAVVAWLQAVSWSPYRWSFVRIFLAVGVLAAFVGSGAVARAHHVSDLPIGAVTIALGMLAYPVAATGLSRARRGDRAEPRARAARRSSAAAARANPPFASAAAAQLWLECRRNAWLAPLFTAASALALAAAFALARLSRPDVLLPAIVPPGVWPIVALLGIPVFVAMVSAAGFGKFDLWQKPLTFPAFLVARPISTAAIVGAKFRSTALATACGWASVLLALSVYVWIPGTYDSKRSVAAALIAHATPRGVAAGCLILLLPMIWSWRVIVQSLWIMLLGRQWIVVVLPTAQIFAAGAIGWAAYGVYADPHLRAMAWPWLRPAVVAAAAVKLVAAALVVAVIRREALMTVAAITRTACIWLAVALGFCVAILVLFPIPHGWSLPLFGAVVLFLPLVRPAVAILALRRNRHR